MNKLITQGISVSVQTRYEGMHSAPEKRKYVHSYFITIENLGSNTVQLLTRHWTIMDSSLVKREVQGEGVIGKQPILKPGETHSYSSWCPLQTNIGKMHGYFTMVNLDTDEEFDVTVPEFALVSPEKLN